MCSVEVVEVVNEPEPGPPPIPVGFGPTPPPEARRLIKASKVGVLVRVGDRTVDSPVSLTRLVLIAPSSARTHSMAEAKLYTLVSILADREATVLFRSASAVVRSFQ